MLSVVDRVNSNTGRCSVQILSYVISSTFFKFECANGPERGEGILRLL